MLSKPTSVNEAGYIITEEDYDRIFKLYDASRKKADENRKKISKEQFHLFRARAKRDLFFLSSSILNYNDLSPVFHAEVCHWIQETFYTHLYSLLLLPRAHFKTSIKTVSHNIQVALPYTEEDRQHDSFDKRPLAYPMDLGPEVRIQIVHEVADEASRFLFMITRHFISNPMLMALFPEVIPQARSQIINKTALELPRVGIYGEPTFDTAGVSAKQQGNHYNLISPDDIFGKEARESEVESSQRKEYMNGIFGFLNNAKIDKIFPAGTRYKFDDVYGHMIEMFGDQMDVYRRKVEEIDPVTKKKSIIFPERITPEFLDIVRKDKKVFYSEWLNDPEEIGEGFPREYWLTYEWLDRYRISVFDGVADRPSVVDIRDMYIQFHIDPGELTGGFVITGTDYWWRTFVLGAIAIDFPTPVLIELIFEQALKWHPYQVTSEADAAQHILSDWVRREMTLRSIFFEIVEYYTKKREKKRRIESLGTLSVAKELFYNEAQVELKGEFDKFGKINVENIHILDALAQIVDEGVRHRGFLPGSFGRMSSVINGQHPFQNDIDPQTGYSTQELGGY